MTTAPAIPPSTGVSRRGTHPDRVLHFGLLAIAIGCLIPVLILSVTEFISYDGYWHLFIATQHRWRQFRFEYLGDAHPILHVLLLRLCAAISHSRLMLRAPSYIPGAIGVYFTGFIAGRLHRSRAYAWLAAAAFGLSITMIQINADVRSYPLCLMFILAAFYCLVLAIQSEDRKRGTRALVLFGILTAGAIASEYYALFFVIACAVGLCYIAIGRRKSAVSGLTPAGIFLAFAIPVSAMAYFYFSHLRHQPEQYGHVSDFYWSQTEPVWRFAVNNLALDLSYIVALPVTGYPVLLSLLCLGLLLFLVFPFLQGKSLTTRAVGLPGVVCVLLLAQMLGAGLLRRYPFGGWERQQSVFFPFLILAGFLLLEQAANLLPLPFASPAVASVCTVLILSNFFVSWRKLPRSSEELGTDQYRTYLANRRSDAVYLDEFTFYAHYIHTNNWQWRFTGEDRVLEQRVEMYRISKPGELSRTVYRSFDLWSFNLGKASDFDVLAALLRQTGTRTITLLAFKQAAGPTSDAQLAQERETATRLAAAAGLHIDSMYDDYKEIVANMSLTTR